MTELLTETQKVVADEIATLISDALRRKQRLTEWEESFVESLKEQMEDPYFMQFSQKQLEKLEAIWEKATRNG